jgi:hypothetical protein
MYLGTASDHVDQTYSWWMGSSFEPAVCIPSKYTLVVESGSNTESMVTNNYFTFDSTKGTMVLSKSTPLDKVGEYKWTAKPWTTGLKTELTDAKYLATFTLTLKHPCDNAKATVPVVSAQKYILGSKTALELKWEKFTFSPATPCNDGTNIKFPDHYTATWKRLLPITEFTTKELETPPISTVTATDGSKSWKILASKETYIGNYELTLQAKYGTFEVPSAQVISLEIYDECEPPTLKMPEIPKTVYEYTLGTKAVVINVPVITVTPTTCKITYAMDIPAPLAGIVKFADNKVNVAGFDAKAKPGTYTFKFMPKTPKG